MAAAPLPVEWPLAQLAEALPGVQVQRLLQVGSTSTELLERLRQGDTRPQLLVAEQQTGGRGRMGRSWQSAAGASLTFSVSRLLAPADWSGLSLAVGATLADAIEPAAATGRARLWLKWPNDLWLADGDAAGVRAGAGPWRKLGGVLIETVAVGAARGCVVGVGLNVEPQADTSGLASGCAWAQELDPRWTAPSLLQRAAPPLFETLARFERDGLAGFAAAFSRRDLLRGRGVRTLGAAAVNGVAEGVDGQGRLLVRTADGLQAIASGEVSVRPAAMRAEA